MGGDLASGRASHSQDPGLSLHQERCTKQGNCLPCPHHTAADALSCHLTSFSVTVRDRERLEDTRLLVRDMFLSLVDLYAWANGWHATVGGTTGYGCCSCPGPYFRALWPAATVVGTTATDRIISLHLILAKRLKSRKRRNACHPDAEGRLLLNLRLTPLGTNMCLDSFCGGCRDIS